MRRYTRALCYGLSWLSSHGVAAAEEAGPTATGPTGAGTTGAANGSAAASTELATPPAADAPKASESAPPSEAPAESTTEAPLEAQSGLAVSPQPAPEPPADAASWGDFGAAGQPVFDSRLYGFINASFEKSADTPARDESGNTIWEESSSEWDVLNFNVMLQGAILQRFRYYFNLIANGAGSNTEDITVDLRNAWLELPLAGNALNVRAGKMYRRFGLYNEILDAVPTFIGIEPPELFDKDHLMLTRTTNFMVHGTASAGILTVNYSATTGNDERSRETLPVGADLNFDIGGWLKIGSSFYYSGPDAVPGRAVGDGSPRGGVVNWMAKDEYTVAGGYLEAHLGGLLVQTEYWNAHHNAERDPEQVALIDPSGLNAYQLARFYRNGDPADAVKTKAVYNIHTFYTRLGYELALDDQFTLTPYAQFDYYKNPEVIFKKSEGGDAEAGLADDNKFFKYTLGAVIRPVQQVAFKVDGSVHQQEFNGRTEIYPEVRTSLSYLWEL